jgi:hypothetical protein
MAHEYWPLLKYIKHIPLSSFVCIKQDLCLLTSATFLQITSGGSFNDWPRYTIELEIWRGIKLGGLVVCLHDHQIKNPPILLTRHIHVYM